MMVASFSFHNTNNRPVGCEGRKEYTMLFYITIKSRYCTSHYTVDAFSEHAAKEEALHMHRAMKPMLYDLEQSVVVRKA